MEAWHKLLETSTFLLVHQHSIMNVKAPLCPMKTTEHPLLAPNGGFCCADLAPKVCISPWPSWTWAPYVCSTCQADTVTATPLARACTTAQPYVTLTRCIGVFVPGKTAHLANLSGAPVGNIKVPKGKLYWVNLLKRTVLSLECGYDQSRISNLNSVLVRMEKRTNKQ